MSRGAAILIAALLAAGPSRPSPDGGASAIADAGDTADGGRPVADDGGDADAKVIEDLDLLERLELLENLELFDPASADDHGR